MVILRVELEKIMHVSSHKFVYPFVENTDNENKNTKLKRYFQILINAIKEFKKLNVVEKNSWVGQK